MLTNHSNTVLYIGSTNNLSRRIQEHKHKIADGFTKKYNLTKLVYAEAIPELYASLEREKQLKNWRRSKKNELIHSMNPEWKDLSDESF
jgi:putative endonuclease